jgi:hypothetical protein
LVLFSASRRTQIRRILDGLSSPHILYPTIHHHFIASVSHSYSLACLCHRHLHLQRQPKKATLRQLPRVESITANCTRLHIRLGCLFSTFPSLSRYPEPPVIQTCRSVTQPSPTAFVYTRWSIVDTFGNHLIHCVSCRPLLHCQIYNYSGHLVHLSTTRDIIRHHWNTLYSFDQITVTPERTTGLSAPRSGRL